MKWTLVPLLTLLSGRALVSASSSPASDRDGIDPAKAWLSQRAARWANMYLPGTAPENSTCQRALQALAASLADNTTLWAAKFVDSWAKVPDGLYSGNWALEGVYDARDARPGEQARLPPLFATRFDLAPFKTYSTCMPDACAEHDLQESVSAALAESSLGVRRVQCHTLHEAPEFTAGDIAFVALLSALLLLMVAASALDVYIERTHNKAVAKGGARFLLPFSVYTNLSKLFQLNTTRSSENITCLHGIRVLSMMWVVYGHQHQAGASFTANFLMMFPKTSGLLYQLLSNAFFSVDSFFFLSGFLVSFVLLREVSRTGRFNIAVFYLHRFIRLLPPIAIATGLFATVARYFLTGPLADSWAYWQKGCIVNWWKDLVFVNNFLLEEEDPDVGADCIGQAWYLAVDTQLYLVAPLVILPLHFFEAAGQAWLYFLSLVSIAIPTAVTYVYDLPPTAVMYDPNWYDLFSKLYVTPWCRAGPWLVGVWLGYVFHKQGQREVVLRKWQVVAGWTTSTVVALLLVLGMWSYNVVPLKAHYDVVTQLTYAGLSRPAWGAVLAWVVYACHFGYGGPVDGFLSHPSWQPISRVTYSTYLVAMQIQYLMTYASKAPFYFTPLNVLMQTTAALVISGMVGVMLSLTAEAPVIGLEKLLLRRPGRGGGGRGPEAPGHDNKAFEGDMEELPRGAAPEGGPGTHDGDVAGQETVTKF
ncbi:nose resistant to fluoxetine protein 6-like [Penaeus monodon]|uniref:nose resistant to fluoxetine protein 6-like n=1 Tax=Penaeus monodon TaxID=6687 RepID=UPI0018A7DC7F|nr:nose resistant to fluoxetine protein 6-like [Penaeus monodon]